MEIQKNNELETIMMCVHEHNKNLSEKLENELLTIKINKMVNLLKVFKTMFTDSKNGLYLAMIEKLEINEI